MSAVLFASDAACSLKRAVQGVLKHSWIIPNQASVTPRLQVTLKGRDDVEASDLRFGDRTHDQKTRLRVVVVPKNNGILPVFSVQESCYKSEEASRSYPVASCRLIKSSLVSLASSAHPVLGF